MKTTTKILILLIAFIGVTSAWAQKPNRGTTTIDNYVQTVKITHDSVIITGELPNQFPAPNEVEIDVQYLAKGPPNQWDFHMINWRSQNGRGFYLTFYSLGTMPEIIVIDNGTIIDLGNGWKKIRPIPLKYFTMTYSTGNGELVNITGFTNYYGVLLLKPH